MRQGGFTLLELLVVVAIIGVIASVTFVRSDLMESDADIKSATGQIVNMAKRARQQSISVAEYRGIFPSYGLHLERGDDSFTIYANCIPDDNENNTVDHDDNFAYNDDAHSICASVMSGSFDSSDAATVDVIDLNEGAFIHKIESKVTDGSYNEVENVSINYLRPEPTVWMTTNVEIAGLSESVIPAGEVKVTIRDKAERFEKDVIFYTTALVETVQRRLK